MKDEEDLREKLRSARQAASIAAATTEHALARLMQAETVINAAQALIDATSARDVDDERAVVLAANLLVKLKAYDKVRPS